MEEASEERTGDQAAPVDEDPSTAPVPDKVRDRSGTVERGRAVGARARGRTRERADAGRRRAGERAVDERVSD